jgi:signal transduction histidine kinase
VPEPIATENPPAVFIAKLRIAGVEQAVGEFGQIEVPEMVFEPDQNNVQIGFFGLGFGMGQPLEYEYKLEGSDQGWSPLSDQRTVNFARLSAGNYRFLVRAVNSEGITSTTPAAVAFRILPPIWQRWWFLILAALAIISGFFAFDRYRVKRLKQLRAALFVSEQLTTELTEQGAELGKANRALAIDAAVTSALVESVTPAEAAPRILQTICLSIGWEIGAIWDFDRQAGVLRCVDVWHPEGFSAAEFEALTRTEVFLSGVGLPGRVLASREPQWIADLSREEDFPRLAVAAQEGLRSGFGSPILLGNDVIGVLEFFSREVREPDPDEVAMMSGIGSHIGQLIERMRADVALRKSREERLMELERVRTRIATDLHDDIGSSLTQIAILSEVAQRFSDTKNKPLEMDPFTQLTEVSNELVETMSDIVWAINPMKDHLSDLVRRMHRFTSDIFSARKISFSFHRPDADDDIQLGANVRREVFLVFKESVNNIVKHSGCSRAEIEFVVEGNYLRLQVSDNGKGFNSRIADWDVPPEMSNNGDGHGLLSMRRRAEEIGGILEIISQKGQGTTVALRVPIIRR